MVPLPQGKYDGVRSGAGGIPGIEGALVSNKQILVVDDDDELREVLAEALTDDGYHVLTASNGAEAFEYVRHERQRVDLVLLDLMMPIMDGQAFLYACRNLPWWAGVPVVVLSAAYRLTSSARELGPNVRATLAKPFDLIAVLALVECLTRGTVR